MESPLDALLPAAMAEKAEQVGVTKANRLLGGVVFSLGPRDRWA